MRLNRFCNAERSIEINAECAEEISGKERGGRREVRLIWGDRRVQFLSDEIKNCVAVGVAISRAQATTDGWCAATCG